MKLYTQIADYFRAHPAASGLLGGGTTLAAVNWERLAEIQERVRASLSTLTLIFTFLVLSPQVYGVFKRWWVNLCKWWRGEPKQRAKASVRRPRAVKKKGRLKR